MIWCGSYLVNWSEPCLVIWCGSCLVISCRSCFRFDVDHICWFVVDHVWRTEVDHVWWFDADYVWWIDANHVWWFDANHVWWFDVEHIWWFDVDHIWWFEVGHVEQWPSPKCVFHSKYDSGWIRFIHSQLSWQSMNKCELSSFPDSMLPLGKRWLPTLNQHNFGHWVNTGIFYTILPTSDQHWKSACNRSDLCLSIAKDSPISVFHLGCLGCAIWVVSCAILVYTLWKWNVHCLCMNNLVFWMFYHVQRNNACQCYKN